MKTDAVMGYLESTDKSDNVPYFLFIGDDEYKSVSKELAVNGLKSIRTSSFCSNKDKLPDIDGLFNAIKTAAETDKKAFVTGLGEYLALRGKEEAGRVLLRLKDTDTRGARVVILLRGLACLIDTLRVDPRFDGRRFCAENENKCDLSFVIADPSLNLPVSTGFKAMLEELENGRCGEIQAATGMNLDGSLFTIRKIKNAHEGVRFFSSGFDLSPSCGSGGNWSKLLSEIITSGGSLEEALKKYAPDSHYEFDFYNLIFGGDSYAGWARFVYLKHTAKGIANGYLRYVLEKTDGFEDFAGNVLKAIIEISHTDERFAGFYKERARLAESFPESYVEDFVISNRKIPEESVYKLSDRTRAEREEIVAWVSRYGFVPEIKNIYPALADYMKKYVFKRCEHADIFTEYFDAYKRQKLSNVLEDDFLKTVDELAGGPRIYNRLPTRNEILDNLDKTNVFLYWLDSMGAEYLSLIDALAMKKGLSIRVSIARAELPTITEFNRDFYDKWPDNNKHKNKDLDDVKHGDSGYDFLKTRLPVHLARELEIVEKVINQAATRLKSRNCDRFLIVSDHGASRLAVLRNKEEKYEADAKGEHSGRCRKSLGANDLPFAEEENGYVVLADYGRFKGSRAANVEVHGGASLEEVIVPIIELSLKNQKINVELIEAEVTVDFRNGAEIVLFLDSPVKNVSAELDGKSYQASQIDENRWSVKFPDIKRPKEYHARVYAEESPIREVTFKVRGRIASIDKDFDDML